ncbi:hypothetical protein [Lacisediminimonas profundi]|uniref:hypothetical protein n=1 Tax=Lacisediminimonas profundi TaxID=2603856 RepID=UPI001883B784|nr:hypothetical protein [Lacisediminimonas profundi]
MDIQEFKDQLSALSWKQADFCRKTGVERNTPSRWINGRTPIPDWVPAYLGAMLAIMKLYEQFVCPDQASGAGQPEIQLAKGPDIERG